MVKQKNKGKEGQGNDIGLGGVLLPLKQGTLEVTLQVCLQARLQITRKTRPSTAPKWENNEPDSEETFLGQDEKGYPQKGYPRIGQISRSSWHFIQQFLRESSRVSP